MRRNDEEIGACDVVLEADNINIIREFVQDGFGLSGLSKSACEKDVRKGHLRMPSAEKLDMAREG